MEKILEGLKKGRTIGQYDTHGHTHYRNQWYFRWNDNLEVVNAKSLWALKRKGIDVPVSQETKIVKY